MNLNQCLLLHKSCISDTLNGCHTQQICDQCIIEMHKIWAVCILDLISLQWIKTLVSVSQRVEHWKVYTCKGHVNRRKRLYWCFGRLIAIQWWSAKQLDHLTCHNQHGRPWIFIFRECWDSWHLIWPLQKVLVIPWKEGNEFPTLTLTPLILKNKYHCRNTHICASADVAQQKQREISEGRNLYACKCWQQMCVHSYYGPGSKFSWDQDQNFLSGHIFIHHTLLCESSETGILRAGKKKGMRIK